MRTALVGRRRGEAVWTVSSCRFQSFRAAESVARAVRKEAPDLELKAVPLTAFGPSPRKAA